MRIIPVLDVMNGTVVRAVGGRRAEYRPIVSRLTASPEPVAVAQALLNVTGASELYVADLDSIMRAGKTLPGEPGPRGPWVSETHRPPTGLAAGVRQNPEPDHAVASPSVRHLLPHLPVTVWLDIGVRDEIEAVRLKQFRHVRPVVASETFDGVASHDDLLQLRPAVSIDLRDGELLSASSRPPTPSELAATMHRLGYRTFILLDLARVGMNAGPGTEPLCGELRRRYPDIELLVGGGVRNRDDLQRLEDAGADGVLVASALHDGTLP